MVTFWALHGALVPYQREVTKDAITKKKVVTRFSVVDSQKSFVMVAATDEALEEKIVEYCGESKRKFHPIIVVVESSIFHSEDYYVYFAGIRYNFNNIVRAVDVYRDEPSNQ